MSADKKTATSQPSSKILQKQDMLISKVEEISTKQNNEFKKLEESMANLLLQAKENEVKINELYSKISTPATKRPPRTSTSTTSTTTTTNTSMSETFLDIRQWFNKSHKENKEFIKKYISDDDCSKYLSELSSDQKYQDSNPDQKLTREAFFYWNKIRNDKKIHQLIQIDYKSEKDLFTQNSRVPAVKDGEQKK